MNVISGLRLYVSDWYGLLITVGCVGGDFSQTASLYKTRIGAHRHIGAYRGAWWLATLRHMAVDDSGNMAE